MIHNFQFLMIYPVVQTCCQNASWVRSLKWHAWFIGNSRMLNQEIFDGGNGSNGFDGRLAAKAQER
jgi:hypothetical protein